MKTIRSTARNPFAGSPPGWAAISLAAAILAVNPTGTGKAAQDAALSPRASLSKRPQNRGTPPTLIEAGPHHAAWQVQAPGGGPAGPSRSAGSYIELASGLNRWDAGRRAWRPAEARFDAQRDGCFVARSTQHQVILAPDLNSEAAVDLLAPDGVRLRSTIIGLALVDAGSGRNVLLAEIKSCQGTQISPGEIVYSSAFDGLTADVRLLVRLDRFEQDVILRERIPPEVVSELGLDPTQTRLLVLTEFFDPPHPARKVRHLPLAGGRLLADEELSFGAMSMAAGEASAAGVDGPGIPVQKSWEILDGRHLLIEAVPYLALLSVSETLPAISGRRLESLRARVRRTAGVGTPGRPMPGAGAGLELPGPRQASSRPPQIDAESPLNEPLQQSTAQTPGPSSAGLLADGVVIDYALTLVTSATNYTFRSGSTYYIAGIFNLTGTTTIEGGCVIKFAPSSSTSLVLHGPVDCRTAPYHPAVLTAQDDDSVGEIPSASTGNPTGCYYGQPALKILVSGQTLHDLRIAHAQTGIYFHDYSAGTNSVRHVQFVRCGTALQVNGYGTRFQEIALHNLLIHDAPQALAGYSFRARAEHLTVCQSTQLATDAWGSSYGTQSSLDLVNSLLVAVPTLGNVEVSQLCCRSAAHSNSVFQTVGAGGFYLAQSSFRNLGTSKIDAALARELRQKTTSPPAICTASNGADLVLAPRVPRDSDIPDPGYHYDPIDYAVSELVIAGMRTLTVLPGACLATYGAYGMRLEPGARLSAEGTPLRPIRLFRYPLVQEQSSVWGPPTAAPVSVLGTDQSAATSPAASSAGFRFVEFLDLANRAWHIQSDASTSRFAEIMLRDCQVRGGRLDMSGDPTAIVRFHNNLFRRAEVGLRGGIQLTAFNNLFRGGSLQLDRIRPAGDWVMRDTAFHDVDLQDINGGLIHSHNAYLGPKQEQLLGSSSANKVLSAFLYASAPLGDCYHATTSLVNAGSRLARDAGLWHHTVHANQTKEADTTVDIGFHYLALGPGGDSELPQDTDADGVADYLEDTNGNGRVDSGETNWRDARDLGLGVRITRPRRSSPVP